MPQFKIQAGFQPTGDQPQAIRELVEGLERGDDAQVLLGVTGSGKTFTIANVIERVQRPTLVLAHNKTLAAQLYQEFKGFFPNNAVEYFVSYYDYYQPEAYIPATNTYIEKDATINQMVQRMRLSATRSLFERRDVILIASVSCIYGLGDENAYFRMIQTFEQGQEISRDELIKRLIEVHYERNDIDFDTGRIRVRGDTVDVFPAYEEALAVRFEFFGDEIDRIVEIDPFRGKTLREKEQIAIFPASHYVVLPDVRERAIRSIEAELKDHLKALRADGQILEANRLEDRTNEDLANLRFLGFCHGVENYSRHFTGRAAGEPPPCLLNYFPDDWMMVIDESHVTVPQIGAMFRGDRSRKQSLIDYGFRLPSALDNRPLQFEEWEQIRPQTIYVSATPAQYELDQTGGAVTEQLIRPTGLLDPYIEVRPVANQVDDLIEQIRHHVDERNDRVLVTTLTKRMAEDLTDYLTQMRIRVRYLHSDVDTLERSALILGLRSGEFDVLIGINLLREGLDIPEVSLVAILDADKEGFLRSERSLIQTSGRAARNSEGRVIMYADKVTRSMKACIDETLRRRRVQEEYNDAHGIIPTTIMKPIPKALESDHLTLDEIQEQAGSVANAQDVKDLFKTMDRSLPTDADKMGPETVTQLREEMFQAARELEFERAAALRDLIDRIEAGKIGTEGA